MRITLQRIIQLHRVDNQHDIGLGFLYITADTTLEPARVKNIHLLHAERQKRRHAVGKGILHHKDFDRRGSL